jgi:hypothetical protein
VSPIWLIHINHQRVGYFCNSPWKKRAGKPRMRFKRYGKINSNRFKPRARPLRRTNLPGMLAPQTPRQVEKTLERTLECGRVPSVSSLRRG